MPKMDPLRLQKQLRDNSNDLQEYFQDIKKWGEEMKRKEESLKTKEENDPQVPLPRNKVTKVKKTECEVQEQDDPASSEAKVPKDYLYWEKFDVEAACEKVDKEKSDSDSELTDEVDESLIEMAMNEKEKGNMFVKMGRYKDAIKCYTSAIGSYAYDPIFYANRALCHLRLKEYKSAEADCTTALQIDQDYVKALHRRAMARDALGQHKEARADLESVLKIESHNKESKKLLDNINKKLDEESKFIERSSQRPASKFALSRQMCKENEQYITSECSSIQPVKAIQDIVERIDPKMGSTIGAPKVKAETIVRPQKESTEKSKMNICWPAGSNVYSVSDINKPPKMRSKMRLRRVEIFDVSLKSQMKTETPENVKSHTFKIPDPPQPLPQDISNKSVLEEFKIVAEKNNVSITPINKKYENLDYSVDTSKEDFSKLSLSVPTTSVQFYNNWKNLREAELKYLYLRQINPTLYTSIFKDSLETKVFSEIIEILATMFMPKNVHVFSYLYGFTKVRRFSTLVMFKSTKDKSELLKLIDFMRTDSSRSKDEVDYLIKKFEM